MKRSIIKTKDGSTTIQIEDWDECYHSRFGAVQEALHVFIKNGLSLYNNRSICILEIGFGTGLNAFVTFLEHQKFNLNIHYTGVEAYPINSAEALSMNFAESLSAADYQNVFNTLHDSPWNENIILSDTFTLYKRLQLFEQIEDTEAFDLIYFDAFGFDVQPELWTLALFQKMYNALSKGGILTTYAARGVIRRNMIAAGFVVEKLSGAPGKREMFRAKK